MFDGKQRFSASKLAGAFALAALLAAAAPRAFAARANLIVNPNFERTYAARRLLEPALKYIRGDHKRLPSYEGKPFMPYGWMMVPGRDGACKVSIVEDGGKRALRVRAAKGDVLSLRQLHVEVVPGAKYNCSLSLKGAGRVSLQVLVREPAPAELLGDASAKAAAGRWTTVSFEKTVGYHRHLASLVITIRGEADLLIRDVRMEAAFGSVRTPESLVTSKRKRDSATLYLEDFDGPSISVQTSSAAKPTGPDGGRFGRGLEISAKEGGSITRLPIGRLPEKGTIEFWFKPRELPAKTHERFLPLILTTQTKGLEDTQLQFTIHHWLGVVNFGFRKERYKHNSAQSTQCAGWGWWRPNTWHHFAGSWDGELMRVYVDGVLSGICYGKDREGNDVVHPRGRAMMLVLKAPGVIDEICISRGLRYGPLIPKGAKTVSYLAPVEKPAPAAATQVKEISAEEIRKLRRKRIRPVPKADGAYAFAAARAKPAWESMGGVRLRNDYFGKGAAALEFTERGLGRAVYWKMEGIQAGKYYIGLWTETSDERYKTEYSPINLMAGMFLNGWPVRFSTTSDPVQVKPGLWIAQLQSSEAVELADGDEIAVSPAEMWGNRKTYLRLELYRDEPRRGHGVTGRTFGVRNYTVQRLRLVVTPEILGSGADGDEHEARITIANPLPYAAEAVVDWKLADYFGAPVAGETRVVKIPAHKVRVITRNFTARGEARAYQLDVRTRPAPGFAPPVPRPGEMLELNDYTRLDFLPNQNGPLTVWNHARRDLSAIKSGRRMRLDLSGSDWERGPLAGRRVPARVPADVKYRRFTVPFMRTYIKLPKGVFGMWYRKKFRVPEWMRGGNYIIDVSQAVCEGTVFLNGVRVGHGAGGLLPIRCDVRGALKLDGENELVICVRDAIALVSPDYVDEYDPDNRRLVEENQDVHGVVKNTACLGSVYLRTAPPVRVKDTMIIPDVEKGRLRVMARVENFSGSAGRVKLKFQVFQEGRLTGAKLTAREIKIADGATAVVETAGPAGDLKPYTPKKPLLAKLVVTATQNDRVIDVFAQRFGYRTLRVRGTDIILNGKRANLLGAFQHFPHNVFEGDDGIDVARDARNRAARDLNDEIGVLNYSWVGIGWAQRWKKLNNKKFWDSLRDTAVELVWERGYHPSIVGWDISNESYHYAPYIAGGAGQEKHGELIYSIAEKIRDAFKSDFWFLADGDEDLGGRLDFCSFHYLNQNILYGWSANPSSLGYFPKGVSHYPPDCFFLNKAARVPRKGTVLSMRPDWVWGEKACGDTETFWLNGGRLGVFMCAYLGDRATVSPAYALQTARGMAWTKMSMDAYRDMRQAFIGGMYWRSFLGVGAQDVTFVMPEQEIRYYAGARFDRRLNIHDDEYAGGELEFTWRLRDENGAVAREGRMKMRSDTAFLRRTRIAFDVPDVKRRTEFTLAMELRKNGRRRAYEERTVDVWPRAALARFTGSVAVFDPKGDATRVLRKLGVRVKPVRSLAAALPSGAKFLLVGPDCADEIPAAQRDTLRAFVRSGGRVIVLRQKTAALLPVDTYVEHRAHFSIGFVRAPRHPITRGLADRDFQMWNPGHLIAKGVYRKPARGNFLALVDSGHEGTLAWTTLMETYDGEGSIVATQLPLVEKFDTEPLCAELLRRMLHYMKEPVYKSARDKLAVLSGASNGVLQRLTDMRADFEVVGRLKAENRVALADLGASDVSGRVEPLRDWVRKGGTLVCHRARPEHADFLAKLTGRKVAVELQPYRSWADRVMIDRPGKLVEGINNIDLYWRPHVRGEDVRALWQVSNGVTKERGQVLFIVHVEGARDFLFPGTLVEVPVGSGRVVVDQLKWEMDEKGIVGGSPGRTLSMLLTNLGVRQKPSAPKPALPKGVTYAPIDISAQANRALRDEKSGDRVGWLDWGPGADLRSFPTGKVVCRGVPFLVPKGDKNAIVLRVNPAWRKILSDYPDTVEIPVKRKNVAGLWFLHTSGWAFGLEKFGERRVHYADGSVETMVLNATNMADWNPGHEQFPDEEYTTTTVAWTGANRQYPIIRVYKTLWVNPHPEKTITKVVITNAGLPQKQWRFMAHLGLTVAELPEKVKKARDAAGSARLLAEGRRLMDSGKTKQAAAKLAEAVEADEHNTAAWQLLVGLRARTASVEEFKALCRRWSAAEPANYQPYNFLGKFLEEKGRLEEALENYRKSIKIEWNQPFTERAIARIKKKLDKK